MLKTIYYNVQLCCSGAVSTLRQQMGYTTDQQQQQQQQSQAESTSNQSSSNMPAFVSNMAYSNQQQSAPAPYRF